jgi:hypothetical protein
MRSAFRSLVCSLATFPDLLDDRDADVCVRNP